MEARAFTFYIYMILCIVWNETSFVVGQRGGCTIVDSTRKGKRFPDSMSKTIPIWCCVLNRSIYNHLQVASQVQEECQLVSFLFLPSELFCIFRFELTTSYPLIWIWYKQYCMYSVIASLYSLCFLWVWSCWWTCSNFKCYASTILCMYAESTYKLT